MTFVITQPCIDTMDQSCVEVCPVDCIQFEEGTDRMLYIDPVVCIDCGACEPACPVTAIFVDTDVPADQEWFTEVNALWFDDAAAARGRVGGDGTPAAASEAAPTAAPAEEAPSAQPEVEAEPAASEPAAEPVAASATPAPEVAVATGSQVEAIEEHPRHAGPVVPQYRLPPATPIISLAVLVTALYTMIMFPGPEWIKIAGIDVGISATILFVAPIAALAGLIFVGGQLKELRLFDAKRDRVVSPWREPRSDWRRSEESRRYELEQVVRDIVADRFDFPSTEYPDLRTYVNVPEPELGLEFTAGGAGGGKVFPDILVVQTPGSYPAIVAQVETRETVTREQASRVWAQMESAETPLFIYVPSGLGARARDYARAAGISNFRIRTWRRQPAGMVVQEL